MLVSFDFDSTLTQPRWDAYNEMWESRGPNWSTLARMARHLRDGDHVIIVTARRRHTEPFSHLAGSQSVQSFVDQYQLPIPSHDIHFTDGKLKGPTLADLGVDLHYDDDLEEIEETRAWNVRAVLVPHPGDPDPEDHP